MCVHPNRADIVRRSQGLTSLSLPPSRISPGLAQWQTKFRVPSTTATGYTWASRALLIGWRSTWHSGIYLRFEERGRPSDGVASTARMRSSGSPAPSGSRISHYIPCKRLTSCRGQQISSFWMPYTWLAPMACSSTMKSIGPRHCLTGSLSTVVDADLRLIARVDRREPERAAGNASYSRRVPVASLAWISRQAGSSSNCRRAEYIL